MTTTGGQGGNQNIPTGLLGKIVSLTALLVALGALLDVGGGLINKTEPFVCKLGFSLGYALPWCGPKRKIYTSTGAAKATSGGQDGHKYARICEPAPEGWHFVPLTGTGIPRPGNTTGAAGGYGPENYDAKKDGPYRGEITPEQACFSVWAYTGDERVTRSFEAGFTAIIER
jgi:hypothetical protein